MNHQNSEYTEPNWERYYQYVEGREPRPLFLDALSRFETTSTPATRLHCIDLGCGDGTETQALLDAGWQVLAIDNEPAAVALLQSETRADHRSQLELRTASFEEFELPKSDFVYAGFSLPFCRPEHFERVWANLAACIRPGGRFAGQLFGVRDSWADNPEMTFHSFEDVDNLLEQRFEVETLQEMDEDGEASIGPKHWHIFDIIAKKTAGSDSALK